AVEVAGEDPVVGPAAGADPGLAASVGVVEELAGAVLDAVQVGVRVAVGVAGGEVVLVPAGADLLPVAAGRPSVLVGIQPQDTVGVGHDDVGHTVGVPVGDGPPQGTPAGADLDPVGDADRVQSRAALAGIQVQVAGPVGDDDVVAAVPVEVVVVALGGERELVPGPDRGQDAFEVAAEARAGLVRAHPQRAGGLPSAGVADAGDVLPVDPEDRHAGGRLVGHGDL